MSVSLTTTSSKASSRKMLVTKVKFFTENPALRRPSRLPAERGGPQDPRAQRWRRGRARSSGESHRTRTRTGTDTQPGRARTQEGPSPHSCLRTFQTTILKEQRWMCWQRVYSRISQKYERLGGERLTEGVLPLLGFRSYVTEDSSFQRTGPRWPCRLLRERGVGRADVPAAEGGPCGPWGLHAWGFSGDTPPGASPTPTTTTDSFSKTKKGKNQREVNRRH